VAQTDAKSPAIFLFTEARGIRSSDEIVAQIRDAVLSDRLTAGDRLPNERDLCVTFGVSRGTLREGLRTLEALGVIEIRPGSAGGIFVAKPDGYHVGSALEALLRYRKVTVDELAEFRVSFESETARLAARRADEHDLEHLDAIADRFLAAARADVPWPTLVDLDISFHEGLAAATKNQVRVAIMLGIHWALQQASISIADYASPAMRRKIGLELKSIAAAVRAGDARLAAGRMRRHVKKFSELERQVSAARDGIPI
jgi:GntR family transcriptional regulator, transcriptional repressor for pyruvate dehydrogenase complex